MAPRVLVAVTEGKDQVGDGSGGILRAVLLLDDPWQLLMNHFLSGDLLGDTVGLADSGGRDKGRRAWESCPVPHPLAPPRQAGLYWSELGREWGVVERWKVCSLSAWLP